MAVHDKLRARLAAVVREFLAEEGLLASPGPGAPSRFAAWEDAAVEVGDALTREVLQQQLATPSEADCHCPTCGAAGLRKKERQRSIQTRRGPLDVTEVECYCPGCRRAFFPSVQSAGTESGLRLQSGRVGESDLCRDAGGQLRAGG